MRTKKVTVNGKEITVKEKRISEIRSGLWPDLVNFYEDKLKNTETADIITLLEEKVSEIFPELTPEDVDNAYFSEIEALIEAFIEVNFTGVKKVALPMLTSFLKSGMSKQQ